MTESSITPPPELVQQWDDEGTEMFRPEYQLHLATRAAQWGADQELLACGNYLKQCAQWEEEDVTEFYNYRRPKPPSLKEQALNGLEKVGGFTLGQLEGVSVFDEYKTHVDNIRRALEALPE